MTGENNGMYMPVGPLYGNGYGNGNDIFGGNSAWFILILLAMFGWGNGFNGFGGGQANGDIQRGFDQQSVMNSINGVQGAVTAGFGNVQTALCNGFAGVNQGIANGFAQAEIAANARQMTDMNQNFQLQSAFQNCCCENRLATAGLNTAITQDGAATRQTIAAGNQAILDKLCQLELDGVKQNYEGQLRTLQNQLAAANLDNQNLRFAASQGAQTAQILANNDAQTAALEQYLAPTPRPAYMVQNPNCCSGQFGYGGCGCNT